MTAPDEHLLVSRFESANVEELAEMLLRPSTSDEKTLRVHLGDSTYVRLHELALRAHAGLHGESPPSPRNVVVLPDFMGSEISAIERGGARHRIWLDPRELADGGFARLRLSSNGLTDFDERAVLRPTGISKRMYGELLLTLLMAGFRVRAFWYDWRKDIGVSAAQLEAEIDNWFGSDEPVHLVAHGMGGLVARTYLARYPQRFAKKESKSRLLMLGTPNHGAFSAVQMLTGASFELRALALLDEKHRVGDLARIVGSFVSLYQMLPSSRLDERLEALYRSTTYHQTLRVDQRLLDSARTFQHELEGIVDVDRMVHVIGHGFPTPTGISAAALAKHDPELSDEVFASHLERYAMNYDGDGIVSCESAKLVAKDGRPVPMLYVHEAHGDLPTSPRVLGALRNMLVGSLEEPWAAMMRAPAPIENAHASTSNKIAAMVDEGTTLALKRLDDATRRVRSLRGGKAVYVSSHEHEVSDALTRPPSARSGDARSATAVTGNFKPPEVHIRVCLGNLDKFDGEGGPAVDVIAAGHYEGTLVRSTLGRLDIAISREFLRRVLHVPVSENVPEKDLLITQLVQRGIIDGRLGKPFFVDDPRRPGRLIVVMGMGLPGRYGVPEAKVLARELCWSIDRLGKRHLATTLIGGTHAKLSVPEIVAAWMRGIKNALTGVHCGTLKQITIVERDPTRAIEIDQAIASQAKVLADKNRMLFHHAPLPPDLVTEYMAKARELAKAPEPEDSVKNDKPNAPRAPTRVTVSLDGDTYSFGAVTDSASIPERPIPLDRRLVEQANEELAAEPGAVRQVELGQFLGKLLVPQDFGAEIWNSEPLILMLDESTARIHWELLAAPEEMGRIDSELGPIAPFLAARGVTRQLRTAFAPLPEPAPPPRRILRVLVVADPAEDAPLPGAEEEGAAVADLFEERNRRGGENRVEVVRMFGPRDATRTAVLRQLMLRTYDVLHFAGHCRYDEEQANASGWVFSNGELLTARELRRLDRVPRFVFSNACQSGITPDRSEQRDPRIAPNFALSFFNRGVSNFVCTAWPVDDAAAREFALVLYEKLLGLGKEGRPLTMHEAMILARKAIASTYRGALTWGAYQHYGNPFSLFFDPDRIPLEE